MGGILLNAEIRKKRKKKVLGKLENLPSVSTIRPIVARLHRVCCFYADGRSCLIRLEEGFILGSFIVGNLFVFFFSFSFFFARFYAG